MKKLTTLLTTLLLTFLLLTAAKCQEADTLVYYTTAQGDSLKAVIQEQDSIILDRDIRIANFQSVFDTYDETELSVIADTFNFEIVDDRIKVELNKAGNNVWIDLVDTDTIISVSYINYERKVILSE